MATPSKTILNVASDHEEHNSVYDFLYHDPERIGSFLAQFEPYGYLQSLTHSQSEGDSSASSHTLSGKAGIPTVASIDSAGQDSSSQTNNEAMTKTYDPLWQNALALLDYLQQNQMLEPNVSSAKIGQFVISTASVWVVNVGLLHSILTSSKLKAEILKNVGTAGHQKGGGLSPVALAMELLSIIPHGIQAHFIGKSEKIWCSLKENGLSTSTGDIYLKHGACIEGEWTVVGVLDAKPDASTAPVAPFVEGMISGISTLASSFRPLVGRPSDYFGITPLLVFRQASGG